MLGNAIQANAVVPQFTAPINNQARASFSEDLVVKVGGPTAISTTTFAGTPVNIFLGGIPEPTAIALLAPAAAILAGVRRRRVD